MSAGVSLGTIASVVGIAAGVNALTGGAVTNTLGITHPATSASGGNVSTASGAQTAVDPYAAYRGDAASLYHTYMQGGSTDITQMPGYQAYETGVMQPALQATQRSAAASGQNVSGNTLAALQGVGQQGYYSFMQNYLGQLATASGASSSPAAGGQAAIGASTASQTATSQGLGALATGLKSLSNTISTPQTSSGLMGNTYGDASNSWAQAMSTQMPSLSGSNIVADAGWSM